MNIIKRAWDLLTKRYGQPTATGQAQMINNTVTWLSGENQTYVKEGYAANDIVYAITTITSEKIKVAPWNVYKVVDESSLKQMYLEEKKAAPLRNYKKIQDLKTKALELYNGDGKLNELLQWPNESETFSDLVAHSAISKMITGNRYLQAILLGGGANQGKPQELYLLPPHLMAITCNRSHPIKVQGYQLSIGNIIPLSKEEVLHDKYYNPDFDISGSHLIGMSPLKAALRTLTNDNASMAASTASFQNMGPAGVLYVDDQRIDGDTAEEQARATKKKLIEEHSGTSSHKEVVVSGYKMGFTEMGISPVDMNILNQQKWNVVRFCNVWNFPHTLVTNETSTYNNVETAEKALSLRCALPLLSSFRANFNRKLQTDWGYKGQNIYVDYDQSCYSELNQDQKELSAWLKDSWHIPLKMKYEIQNLEIPDYIDEELLQKIYVPSGFTELSQLQSNGADLQRQMDMIDATTNQNSGESDPNKD